MRQDYQAFRDRDAEIIAISPDKQESLRSHWESEAIPFPAVPDPDKDVLERLGQEFRLLKFGRMPSVLIIGRDGTLAYAYRGNSASDIPGNDEVLAELNRLNQLANTG